jgi:hypothetical protein
MRKKVCLTLTPGPSASALSSGFWVKSQYPFLCHKALKAIGREYLLKDTVQLYSLLKGTVQLYSTVVQYSCTVQLYSTVVQYSCTVQLYSTVVQYSCTVQLYSTVVQYSCTVQLYSTVVQYSCTVKSVQLTSF